ncbi:MAG: D-glycerate dehydrogenase [Candidatus Doudnabacteria bacterium]|nr:D-glycerate dehydrogenase [Candidatus Doudnabacteria bacterium]
MAKVFVTHEIPVEGLEMLREAGHDVTVASQEDVIEREALLEGVRGVDAILPLLTETIDAEVLDTAGAQLKIVANYAVGYDNIDLEAAAERNVVVTNTPGVLTQTVAEHAIALMMAVTNQIVQADAFTRAGKYEGWKPNLFIGNQFHKKTIGIVGAGRIGYTTAKIAHEGFNMLVKYTNTKPNEQFDTEFGAKQLPLEELLACSDFVSIHVPLTDETHHLIDAEALKQMKSTAFLINTARGPVIDETALVEALQTKQIAGAALDVFEHEPQLAPGLTDLENVVLTPHIASATIEARTEMSKLAAQNIVEVLEGKDPVSPVRSH